MVVPVANQSWKSQWAEVSKASISPIKLTAQILLGCGFKKYKRPICNDWVYLNKGVIVIDYKEYLECHYTEKDGFSECYYLCFLHELQNLFFEFTEQNLEIKTIDGYAIKRAIDTGTLDTNLFRRQLSVISAFDKPRSNL